MVHTIDDALFRTVAEEAAASPRLRKNHNFHTCPQDNPHRFLNVLVRGTYVQPHRHVDPPKAETFLVLEGQAEVIIFDDNGTVTDRYRLGGSSTQGKTWGVDLAPGVWHTILPLSECAVCFEVKPGPWEPASDKDFAPWAPKEGDPAVAAYLKSIAGTVAPVEKGGI